ncbi:flagellar hook-length control protein FliK [Rhodobacter calidifons]|nr:flagellar hook-length control protein FliK [Rhodobacter calidifons]
MLSAAAADPWSELVPASPPGSDWTPDTPLSMAGGRTAAPEFTGPSPVADSRPTQSAGSVPGTPAGEAGPDATSLVVIPAGGADVATAAFHFRRGAAENEDAAANLPKPVEPAEPAELLTGAGSAAGSETDAATPNPLKVGSGDAPTHRPTPSTFGPRPDLAEDLPAHPIPASAFRQTGADQTGPTLPSESDQTPPAAQAFDPDRTAYGGRRSGSIWERAFLDTTRDHAAGPFPPASNSPEDDPAVPVAVLQTGMAGPVTVSGHVSVDPGPWPVAPITAGASGIIPEPPEALAAIRPAVRSADGRPVNHVVGMLVESWPDPSPGRSDAPEEQTAVAVMVSSPGQASPSGAKVDLAPHLLSHVGVQLAAVLSHGSGGVTELALAPAELGRVRLRMKPDAADPDRLVVIITVERPETLDLFRRHAGDLAEAIRNAGFSGSSIDFAHDGEDRLTRAGHEDRGIGASAVPEDEPPTQTPMRHLLGETLDLRL